MTRISIAICVLLAFCGVSAGDALAQGLPGNGLLAHYRFDGNGKDDTGRNPDFDLKNAEFSDDALFLNGVYEYVPGGRGYRAVAATPGMSYQTFSVVLRFKLATPSEGASQPNLVTGGTSNRWFGVRFSDVSGGKLILYLNNGDYAQRMEGTAIKLNTWTTVACTVDIPQRRIAVYQDGRRVGGMELPRDFVFDVVSADPGGADKNWSFTNYSGSDTFHGWIGGFALYGRILTAEEIRGLSLGP